MTDMPSSPGLAGPLPEPRAVGAGRGLDWIKEGWGHFKQAPGIWILMIIVYCVILVVIAFIPVINLLTSVLGPVWLGGFMLGCRAQDTGQGLTLSHLFAGFQNRFVPLLLLGLLTGVVTTVLLFAVLGQSFMEILALSAAGTDPATATSVGLTSLLLRMLVFLALLVPLAMAVWFAPSLIVLDGVPLMDAVKLSFRGCLKNVMPFLVYGVVAMILGFVAVIPFGLGLLVLMPVIIASAYRSYRDIFAS